MNQNHTLKIKVHGWKAHVDPPSAQQVHHNHHTFISIRIQLADLPGDLFSNKEPVYKQYWQNINDGGLFAFARGCCSQLKMCRSYAGFQVAGPIRKVQV